MAEGYGMSPVLPGQISLLAMRASNAVHQGLSSDCHRLFIPELKRPPRMRDSGCSKFVCVQGNIQVQCRV